MSAHGPFFDRIGIDRNGVKLVAHMRGMITLTRDTDGVHTLWIYNHPLEQGNAITMRAKYEEYRL